MNSPSITTERRAALEDVCSSRGCALLEPPDQQGGLLIIARKRPGKDIVAIPFYEVRLREIDGGAIETDFRFTGAGRFQVVLAVVLTVVATSVMLHHIVQEPRSISSELMKVAGLVGVLFITIGMPALGLLEERGKLESCITAIHGFEAESKELDAR